ncbi:hypothetical protein MLD38_035303 [Melastoma candidum]|uniref:Uncharacterized protein n=1 Tax=Melastoma candidum TaxID=119954 RepID=A0ACB9MCU2_9MYRT|nr:hypothetical protein MLD38_035303 [Melastoma candidum]
MSPEQWQRLTQQPACTAATDSTTSTPKRSSHFADSSDPAQLPTPQSPENSNPIFQRIQAQHSGDGFHAPARHSRPPQLRSRPRCPHRSPEPQSFSAKPPLLKPPPDLPSTTTWRFHSPSSQQPSCLVAVTMPPRGGFPPQTPAISRTCSGGCASPESRIDSLS